MNRIKYYSKGMSILIRVKNSTKGGNCMIWMYILFGIILLGCGLWGWIARMKWMEKQAEKVKNK